MGKSGWYWCILMCINHFVILFPTYGMMIWILYYILYWSFFRGWNHKPATGEYVRVKAPPIFFDAENASHDAEGPLGPMRPPWMSRSPREITQGSSLAHPNSFGSQPQADQENGADQGTYILVLVFNYGRPKLNFFAMSSSSSSGDQSLVVWAGSRLLKDGNLIRNSPSPAMKFVGSALGPQGSQV